MVRSRGALVRLYAWDSDQSRPSCPEASWTPSPDTDPLEFSSNPCPRRPTRAKRRLHHPALGRELSDFVATETLRDAAAGTRVPEKEAQPPNPTLPKPKRAGTDKLSPMGPRFADLATSKEGCASLSAASPWRDWLLIILCWVLAISLVDPSGEFPLNDDWAFSSTVARLVGDGSYRPSDWVGMTFLSQAYWGWLVSELVGHSHENLRLSTLFLGAVALCSVYSLALDAGSSRGAALLAAATLAVNPVFFELSHTFMSDVPFTAMIVLSTLLLARSVTTGSDVALFLGTAAAVAATLCRQVGLAIPIAFVLVRLLAGGPSLSNLARAAAPLLICGAALLGFEEWMRSGSGLPRLYGARSFVVLSLLVSAPALGLSILAKQLATLAIYLGAFLLPVGISGAGWPRQRWGPGGWIGALVALASGAAAIRYAIVFPSLPNILSASGLGPFTLRDVYVEHLPQLPRAPDWFLYAVTASGAAGAGLVAASLWRLLGASRASDGSRAPQLLLAGSAVLLAGPIVLTTQFDRYLIPSLALIAPLAVTAWPRERSRGMAAIACVILGIYAGVAIAGTHDYLAWNRQRWVALDDLAEQGVKPSSIDGGFEFNATHFFDIDRRGKGSWWWVMDGEYVVAFGPMSGYSVSRRYDFARWLPPGRGQIVVLHRNR